MTLKGTELDGMDPRMGALRLGHFFTVGGIAYRLIGMPSKTIKDGETVWQLECKEA